MRCEIDRMCGGVGGGSCGADSLKCVYMHRKGASTATATYLRRDAVDTPDPHDEGHLFLKL